MKCCLTEYLSLTITFIILTNLPTSNHAVLNLRFCLFMITSLKPRASKKLLLLHFLICQLPLIPLIILFFLNVSLPGLKSLLPLTWFKSYPQNRSFYVTTDNCNSSSFQHLFGVPQGYVLSPLLFILYTTPLSTFIAQSSAQHQLFADATQLFLSFSGPDFSFNITHLQLALKFLLGCHPIFFSLNSSKTEFCRIGLPGQLKMFNTSTTHHLSIS